MLYIITPVYNRKEFTRNYLNSLSKQSVKDFKVVIVDDGSTDGTSLMIKEYFPDVILLQGDGNLWWAEATNIGVRYALDHGADRIMTLNDDTQPNVDYIEKMLFWAEKKPKALLGALAINVENGKPWYGGEVRSWLPGKDRFLLNEIPIKEQYGLHKVNVFPGRGLLIPSEVFQKTGFYDSKNFPQRAADDDFACRAIRKGYDIFCNYDAIIKAFPDESTGEKFKKQKNLTNFYKHLFSIRGDANLKIFTIYAVKNAPIYYLIPFLTYGWLVRIIGYWVNKRQLKEAVSTLLQGKMKND